MDYLIIAAGKLAAAAVVTTLEILKLFGHPTPLLQELTHKQTANNKAIGTNFFEMFILRKFKVLCIM